MRLFRSIFLCILFVAAACAARAQQRNSDVPVDAAEKQDDPLLRDSNLLLKQFGFGWSKSVDDDSLVESKVLEKAFNDLFTPFVKEHIKDRDPEAIKKLGKPEDAVAKLREMFRRENRLFFRATPDQQRQWKKGEFDDRAAKARAEKIVKVLADFDVALPNVSVWVIKKIEGGKLSGAELEIAARTLVLPLSKLVHQLSE